MAGPRGDRLRQLASRRLDGNGLHRLARSIAASISVDAARPLVGMRLGMISNATTDLLAPVLVSTAARYGVALSIVAAPFGVTMQAAMASDSQIRGADPDVVLMGLDYRAFFNDHELNDDPDAAIEAAIADVKAAVRGFRADARTTIIVQTLAPPPERLFGNLDRRQPGTLSWLIAKFNERLCSEVVGVGVALLDVESMASAFGLEAWYNRIDWFSARLPFSQKAAPVYAESVARILGAIRGKSRRALVLDLDNTLWGGVVGDDGVHALKLGQGDPVGEAFLDVQRAALALKKRGILLAICSKNDDATARTAIREHPDMLLRENDFAAMRINWNDKASNVEAIAKELSLGLDAFVFFDDNPVEREQVRSALPQVCVPEVPADPESYGRILLTGGFFESIAFSQEDRNRAELYAVDAARHAVRSQARDLGSFLQSLQMSIAYLSDGPAGWRRFAQLINKSNQFNLTGRRCGEAEILALAGDPLTLTLQVRLIDRFGDNGMISAIICRRVGDDWVIDTWVMSCRVLDRQVEMAVLNEIVRRAAMAGVARLVGVYRPTDRNCMVAEHYDRLGFSRIDATPECSRWALEVDTFTERAAPIANSPPPLL
jgi:FkbH-like protein